MAFRKLALAGFAILLSVAGACEGAGTDSNNLAGLLILAGNGQFGLPAVVLPDSLVVRAVDENGAGMAGIPVNWNGVGTVQPAGLVTDNTGRLAASWTLPALGPGSVNATAGSFTVTFTATATASPPSELAIVTQPTAALSGVSFSVQPIIEVRNAQGVPIPQAGVTVQATLASGNSFASLGGTTTAVTAVDGRATFSGLEITGPVGNYTLRFTASGLTAPVSGSIDLSFASGRIPLDDMGARTYQGFAGGLYASGSNTMSAAHAAAGAARARAIQPLNTSGALSASGKIVLMSIGLSNTSQEWCDDVYNDPCNAWTFTGKAAADAAVNHGNLVIVNGAKGGETVDLWDSPSDANYDRVETEMLAPRGLSEAQVQVIWLKTVFAGPSISLPAANADAVQLVTGYGNILRALRVRYPNLQMVFMSSRSYGGYAVIALNPEPYAYESGFAVKWTIAAQIDQMANGGSVVDARAGDLNYTTAAPWVAWGPYFWTDGTNPRSDGLVWTTNDVQSDGTHASTSGETKIGAALLTFFKTDPHTSCWFLAGGTCP